MLNKPFGQSDAVFKKDASKEKLFDVLLVMFRLSIFFILYSGYGYGLYWILILRADTGYQDIRYLKKGWIPGIHPDNEFSKSQIRILGAPATGYPVSD